MKPNVAAQYAVQIGQVRERAAVLVQEHVQNIEASEKVSSQDKQLLRKEFAKTLKRCGGVKCSKPGLKYCSKCMIVKYCGRDCQLGDWAVHKIDCKRWRQEKEEEETSSEEAEDEEGGEE